MLTRRTTPSVKMWCRRLWQLVALRHGSCRFPISAIVCIVPKLTTFEALNLGKWHIEFWLCHLSLSRLLGPRRVPANLWLFSLILATIFIPLRLLLLHGVNLHRRIAGIRQRCMHLPLQLLGLLSWLTDPKDPISRLASHCALLGLL